MSRDKNLIYEQYSQRVLLSEVPSYVYSGEQPEPPSSWPVATDPAHGGVGFGLGTYAQQASLNPLDAAKQMADVIKKTLFKPTNRIINGKTYDLEFDGERKELEDAIAKILIEEFKKRGARVPYKACDRAARQVMTSRVLKPTYIKGTTITTSKAPVTNQPSVVVASSADIDDVFDRLFKTPIIQPKYLELESNYIKKDVDIDSLLKSLNLPEDRIRIAIKIWNELTPDSVVNGQQILSILGQNFGYPYKISKQAATDLLQAGAIEKKLNP
jgi:hypothetical protein